MKALTLHQPWASAIAFGFKKYETRPRKTNHRGLIAIHAGKTINEDGYESISHLPFKEYVQLPLSRRWGTFEVSDLPTGVVVAVAELVECLVMDDALIASQTPDELALGHWEAGRYAYQLENVQKLKTPVVARGRQGMWDWEPQDGDLDGIEIQ